MGTTKVGVGILTTLTTLYLGICAYAAHTLSLPKRNFNPAAVNVFSPPPQTVELVTSDGVKLAAWYSPNSYSNRALILVHGMNSSRTKEFGGRFPEFAAQMHQQGFTIFMVDLRGHGKSADARFTFGLAEKNDVVAAIAYLKEQGFPPQKIGILGVSMGGASSLKAIVTKPEIGALVLDGVFAEVYPIIEREWQSASNLPQVFLPATMTLAHMITGYDLANSKPVDTIAKIEKTPILIIHSAIESYIPVQNAYALRKSNPQAQLWQTQAQLHAHNYNHDPKAYVKTVSKFFKDNLR